MNDKRSVVFVSEIFYPDQVSTAYFMSGIAEAACRAMRVVAICTASSSCSHELARAGVHRFGGIAVVRARRFVPRFSNILLRLASGFANSLTISLNCLRLCRNGDVVVCVTNPPVLPFFIAIVCLFRRLNFILLVHDVYPDVLAASGFIKRNGGLYRGLDLFSRWLLKRCDSIVVIGRDMERLVLDKMSDCEFTINLIPNWGRFSGLNLDEPVRKLRVASKLEGKIVFVFAGNMGHTHDTDVVLEAASLLAHDDRFHFFVIGEGSRGKRVRSDISKQSLSNISFLGRLPDNEFEVYLAVADVALIAFKSGMLGVSVPSRLYSLMMASKPVIGFSDRGSELSLVISEEAIGWNLEPGDFESFVSLAKTLPSKRNELAEMGRRAREAALVKYSYGAVSKRWVQFFEQL